MSPTVDVLARDCSRVRVAEVSTTAIDFSETRGAMKIPSGALRKFFLGFSLTHTSVHDIFCIGHDTSPADLVRSKNTRSFNA